MSITIFDMPIQIIVIEHGVEIEGFALYVESGGPHANDIWTVAHCETGVIRHYTTKQLKYPSNQTFNVISNEKESSKKTKGRSRNGNTKQATRNKKNVQKTKKNP